MVEQTLQLMYKVFSSWFSTMRAEKIKGHTNKPCPSNINFIQQVYYEDKSYDFE